MCMDAASQFGDLVRGVRHSGGFEILGQLLGAARSMVFGWSIQKTDVVHDNRRQHNTHVSALCFAYDNRVQGVAVDVFPVMSGQVVSASNRCFVYVATDRSRSSLAR